MRYTDYSVSEYKVDYEWCDLYVEPSVPKGRTMVHPTGKRTVLKMNQETPQTETTIQLCLWDEIHSCDIQEPQEPL